MRTIALALVLALPVGLVSCGGNSTAQTPAPPKSVDQTLALGLLDAQTAIEEAVKLIPGHPGLRDPLVKLNALLETAKSSYLVYHYSLAQGGSPDPTQLLQQVQVLVQNAKGLVLLYGAAQ